MLDKVSIVSITKEEDHYEAVIEKTIKKVEDTINIKQKLEHKSLIEEMYNPYNNIRYIQYKVEDRIERNVLGKKEK